MRRSIENLFDSKVVIVVIGRNEGKRLRNCLKEVLKQSDQVVYVDSGSTDSSVDLAASLNVRIVELSDDVPFTAARARNAGLNLAAEVWTEIAYVQFLDGDCLLEDHWLNTAEIFLDDNPHVAVVCGMRTEQWPYKSVYNMFCNIEWNASIGQVTASGGDFMVRVKSMQEVGGFNDHLIAGEEPELCFRLRKAGWTIWRLDQCMTKHDANMTRFSQWAKRTERSGYAFQKTYFIHRLSSEKFNQRELQSIYFWGLVYPSVVLGIGFMLYSPFLIVLLAYPLKVIQISLRFIPVYGVKLSSAYAVSLFVGKFFQVKGAVSAIVDQARARQRIIIEYKD
jgi:GT2 family glycosyltransferase